MLTECYCPTFGNAFTLWAAFEIPFMQKYRKDISINLLLLRICFLTFVGVCIFLTMNGNGDYAFVLGFIILLCCVFPLTSLSISTTIVEIKRFFAFGFVWKSWAFERSESLEVRTFFSESTDNYYLPTGEWLDIFSIFLPRARTQDVIHEIVHTDIIGNRTRIKLKLSEKEVRLLEEFSAAKQPCP